MIQIYGYDWIDGIGANDGISTDYCDGIDANDMILVLGCDETVANGAIWIDCDEIGETDGISAVDYDGIDEIWSDYCDGIDVILRLDYDETGVIVAVVRRLYCDVIVLKSLSDDQKRIYDFWNWLILILISFSILLMMEIMIHFGFLI